MSLTHKHLTKQYIGKVVRRNLVPFTNKSIKAMHPDTRLYPKDAAGKYDVNSNTNTLGVNFEKLLDVLAYIEEDLFFQLPTYPSNIILKKKDIYNTSIRYHKDTRLHHLIDFIHDEYNKYVATKENLNKEIKSDEVSGVIIEENSEQIVKEKECFYIITVKNFAGIQYLSYEEENVYKLLPYSKRHDASLFTKEEIDMAFDLNDDDIIENLAQKTESDALTIFLKALPYPFEISFIKLEETDRDTWIYGENDKINAILNNSSLSEEDRALIRSRLR